jgi:hypothetical protein
MGQKEENVFAGTVGSLNNGFLELTKVAFLDVRNAENELQGRENTRKNAFTTSLKLHFVPDRRQKMISQGKSHFETWLSRTDPSRILGRFEGRK